MRTPVKSYGAVFLLAATGAAVTAPDALRVASGRWSVGGPSGADGVDALAAAVMAPVVCVVLLWLAVGTLAGLLGTMPGAAGRTAARLHRHLLPRLLRGVLAGSAGAGVLLAPIAASAHPAPGGTQHPGIAESARTTAHTPSPPIWPTTDAGQPTPTWPTSAPTSPSTSPSAGTHTVVAGESLWLIAAQRLPSASPAQIAGYWPQIYAANRDVIGPDPAVIQPGQALTQPDPTRKDRS